MKSAPNEFRADFQTNNNRFNYALIAVSGNRRSANPGEHNNLAYQTGHWFSDLKPITLIAKKTTPTNATAR
jgi:hypothetical protein